jgi:carbon storage regulator
MLVIRRYSGQSIVIGDNIEIQIIETTPTRVKLGIVAPPEIPVMRKEVQLTREENRAAARGGAPHQLTHLLERFRHDR